MLCSHTDGDSVFLFNLSLDISPRKGRFGGQTGQSDALSPQKLHFGGQRFQLYSECQSMSMVILLLSAGRDQVEVCERDEGDEVEEGEHRYCTVCSDGQGHSESEEE